jgi:murein DD-endopeptidase MepM/ murein hydrolase activator NlpD
LLNTIDRLFPERQIILRTNGEVVFLPLSKRKQIAMAGIALFCLAGVGYFVVSLVYSQYIIAENEQTIAQFADEYKQLKAKSQSTNNKLINLADILDTHKTQVSKLVDQRSNLQSRLSVTRERLQTVQAQAQAVSRDKEFLNNQISDLEGKIALFTNSQIQSSKSVQKAEEALTNTETMIASLIDERNLIASENERLEGSLLNLRMKIRDLEVHQGQVIDYIKQRAENNISELEGAVKITGLKLDDILTRHQIEAGIANSSFIDPGAEIDMAGGASNIGGPYIRYSELPGILDPEIEAVARSLGGFNSRLDHLVMLNRVLSRLPLSFPVQDGSKITSKFGKRRDPFKKTWAKHMGVDFGPGYKAPIYATAPGKVTFVGWRGPYGRSIDVDHGHGIVTQYSHLRKILVKNGEQVKARQRIGLVGSSGRSTGAHLHYEVRFDGKPLNPEKFLKAGQNVLETR